MDVQAAAGNWDPLEEGEDRRSGLCPVFYVEIGGANRWVVD